MLGLHIHQNQLYSAIAVSFGLKSVTVHTNKTESTICLQSLGEIFLNIQIIFY